MRLFNLLILLLLPSISLAEVSLVFGGWSHHHLAEPGYYNEVHKVHGVKVNDYIVAGFTNSYNDYAIAAGKKLPLYETKYFESNVYVGMITGYKDYPLPMALPTLTVPLKRLKLNLVSVGVVSFLYLEWEL